MKVAIDSCSAILLAKATILEALSDRYELVMTEEVYKEILKGKEKKFIDALLTERLVKEKKIKTKSGANGALIKKLMQDFNLGVGEAETLALAINRQCEAVITDNRQGRKTASVYKLNLVGSIDVIIALHKLGLINKDKTLDGLKKLREFGWFANYLIDNALQEVKNA